MDTLPGTGRRKADPFENNGMTSVMTVKDKVTNTKKSHRVKTLLAQTLTTNALVRNSVCLCLSDLDPKLSSN